MYLTPSQLLTLFSTLAKLQLHWPLFLEHMKVVLDFGPLHWVLLLFEMLLLEMLDILTSGSIVSFRSQLNYHLLRETLPNHAIYNSTLNSFSVLFCHTTSCYFFLHRTCMEIVPEIVVFIYVIVYCLALLQHWEQRHHLYSQDLKKCWHIIEVQSVFVEWKNV